ncbi:ABC transporter permease [Reichenbachiella sp. MALMAid0571]|uniref:ABC transporter permease n=1 Tax=Reichenbachiella sp. MALMAid0571 TaxID=3143939 RepID=UPI0032DE3AE3
MGKIASIFFNYTTIVYLTIVLILCVFSNPILGILGLDTNLHLDHTNVAPSLSGTYLLGSDHLGKDVFAMLLSGTKFSIAISLCSALLASIIGVAVGVLSGFYGDDKLKTSRSNLFVLLVLFPFAIHYLNLSRKMETSSGSLILVFFIIIFLLLWKLLNFLLKKIPVLKRSLSIPVDFINMKWIEILFAIPTYFLLLALSGVFSPSVYSLVAIIGITSWPKTALLTRSEMLKIREMDFMHSLKLSGIPWYQILWKHAIPNAISPAIVDFVFFASALLVIESTLSFIGIGLPGEIISWGKILTGFKYNSASWWTALFPGMTILITILSFHRAGKMVNRQ